MTPGHETAAATATAQARFDRLRERFPAVLRAARAGDEPGFVRADWRERNAELARYLLPLPPARFLRHPAIRYQMFVDERMLGPELPYVLGRLGDPGLLAEDEVGDPPRSLAAGVLTSSNTVHHLHHLLRYEDATGRRLGEAATVVEWGGGYGNLAKLLLRLHGGTLTYVTIDTPVFAAIQWLYLSSVLGPDRVVLARMPGPPAPGVVTVVPVGLAGAVEVTADLFVSTWALNESTPAAQRHVVERAWFGADGLLVAMHGGDPLEPAVLAAGARPVPVGDWLPGQRYLVR